MGLMSHIAPDAAILNEMPHSRRRKFHRRGILTLAAAMFPCWAFLPVSRLVFALTTWTAGPPPCMVIPKRCAPASGDIVRSGGVCGETEGSNQFALEGEVE